MLEQLVNSVNSEFPLALKCTDKQRASPKTKSSIFWLIQYYHVMSLFTEDSCQEKGERKGREVAAQKSINYAEMTWP